MQFEKTLKSNLQPVKKKVPQGPAVLKDIASVVRSKNSGPFEITLDVLFDDIVHFRRVKESGALDLDVIKKHYHLQKSDVLTYTFFEPALGWKCTFKRPWPQGSIGETDTFGAQQHAPLLTIPIPAAKGGAKAQ
jgi:hypothetical protein